MKRLIILFFISCLACPGYGQDRSSVQRADRRNLVTREWNTDVRTDFKFLDHETIYDADGMKIQETEYSRQGKVWSKKYEYGTGGKVSRELTYNEFGRLDNIQTFEYDGSGRKSAVYTYDARGKLVKVKIYEYRIRGDAD